MNPFVQQLAGLCRSNPAGAKWVFVPSHGVGHALGEQIALSGVAWANLRFTPQLDMAMRMAAPFLVERGIEPLADELGPALVMRLMAELPAAAPGYFRPLAEQPKMADALWGAIRELRMAGIAADALPRGAFERAEKHAEIQTLLRAYEEHLATARVADAAAVYHEALLHPEMCPVLPGDVWTEAPGVFWAPLGRRFLDTLPGTRLPPAGLEAPGVEVPRRLALCAGPASPVNPSPRTDAERLAFLLRPEAAPPSLHDGTVAMFRAGGKEAEAEEVLRRVFEGAITLDQVEVACASADYPALFWEKAQRHEWPITVGPGVPVTLTRPARALLAFCAWIEEGFPAGGLRRLLQSGDLPVEIEEGPTAGQAARLLAASEATWGRATYAPALAMLALSYEERAEDPEADEDARARDAVRAARARRLTTWIEGLLAIIPAEDGEGRVVLGDLLDGCATFLGRYAAVGNALDAAGLAALTAALEELRALAGFSRPLGEALGIVRDWVEKIAVGRDRARPGHLHVSLLAQAGAAGRAHTFVVGLEEGSVFPPLIEDAVLLDRERAAIHPALPTSRDRVAEALYTIVSRLAVLGGRVCLSHSCRDLRESRETFPSWLLLQALRVREGRPDLTYKDLDEALGEPVSPVPARPEAALSKAGWWLAQVRSGETDGLPAARSAFPFLAQGDGAETLRRGDGFTVYDGRVTEAGERLDPRTSGRAVSATSLEGLAACPFRYFLEKGLGLEPVEDVRPEADRWLDPLTRGSVLHGLYAQILREARARGERPDSARRGERLRELGEAKLRELYALIPPPSERVFEQERTAFLRDLEVFLSLEARAEGRTPIGLEVSFGAGAAEGEPLARAEPVVIDLGAGIRFLLRGRIDRIDRLADGSYEVVDYKTGRDFLPGGLAARFAAGRQLQHALYALAATQLLRAQDPAARVLSSAYYFPTVRGGGQRPARPQVDPAALAAVLRDLFAVLAEGTFVHTAKESDCTFCQFHRACGSDPVGRAKQKLRGAGAAALEAYGRLAKHV